jgi:hypothetical protein
MTDTEINALIAELSTSDTFPAFESASKALLYNVDKDGKGLSATPEAISVADKLLNGLKDSPMVESANVVGRVMCGVLPIQAHSLWTAFLSNGELKSLVMPFQVNKAFAAILRDYIYRMHSADRDPYDLSKMDHEQYAAHIAFLVSGPSNDEVDQHLAELSDLFPFGS